MIHKRQLYLGQVHALLQQSTVLGLSASVEVLHGQPDCTRWYHPNMTGNNLPHQGVERLLRRRLVEVPLGQAEC